MEAPVLLCSAATGWEGAERQCRAALAGVQGKDKRQQMRIATQGKVLIR